MLGQPSEARRLGVSSAYDDFKSRFNEDDVDEEVSQQSAKGRDKNSVRLKSHQSSKKSQSANIRPDSARHEDLINELEELIDL